MVSMEENQPVRPSDPATIKAESAKDAKPRVRDLFSWKSLNRPQKQYSKEVFSTLAAIAFLVSLILALFQEWLTILVTWAAYFLFWALTKVPPEEVEHKITTQGIVSMNRSYLWSELGPFWFTPSHPEGFTAKENETVLHISHRSLLNQLALLVDPKDREKIQESLAEYLPFIEVPEKSLPEKLSHWFAKKFPIQSGPINQKPS